jgi:glycerate kinase
MKIPVVAVCGTCDVPAEALRDFGLKTVLEISDPAKPLSFNMEHAYELTAQATERFLVGEKKG